MAAVDFNRCCEKEDCQCQNCRCGRVEPPKSSVTLRPGTSCKRGTLKAAVNEDHEPSDVNTLALRPTCASWYKNWTGWGKPVSALRVPLWPLN